MSTRKALFDVDWSETEIEVLNAVRRSGALSVRSLIRRFGPFPNWTQLVDWGFLLKTETTYGPVLTLAAATRDCLMAEGQLQGRKLKIAYLRGPGAIVDRAYQADAIAQLRSEGFTRLRHTYKQRGAIREKSNNRYTTDQIVSSTLRVPDDEAEVLEAKWGVQVQPLNEVDQQDYSHRLGYPTLYATISGGGIHVKRVIALLKVNRTAIVEWRSPLLVVVPDLAPFRDLQRRLDAIQEIELRQGQSASPRSYIGTYPELRLIAQPFPTRGKSD